MGEKAELLFGEILIGAAFFGGVWSAIKFNPEQALVHVLGRVIAELVGAEAASNYILAGELVLLIVLLLAVLMAFLIGGKIALAAFGVMWIAGYLLVLGNSAGVVMLFVGWGLGAAAILIHTDENLGPPAGGFNY